jgi:hypothetical protein
MLRTLLIGLSCLAAFDHFIGDDKGAIFLAAILPHFFH